jgi:hypothetical protein
MTPAGAVNGAAVTGNRIPHDDQAPAAEPRWLTEVRLRIARRVLWLRQLWSEHRYADEHLLAISHSEVDRALVPRPEMQAAEAAFYQADERAVALSARLTVLGQRPEDARMAHLTAALGLSQAESALFTLTMAGAADQGIARAFGYLLDQAEAAEPAPGLAAALFWLSEEPLPGPACALVRWLLAEPVVSGRDAFARSTGWRADSTLLGDLLAPGPATAGWSGGSLGHSVTPPPGPVLRPAALEEIVGFARKLATDGRLPVEIELAGAPGSGRTALAAQAAQRLGFPLIAVDAAALMARADPLAAAVREVRRARLEGAMLAWEQAEALPAQLREAMPRPALTFESVPASGGVPAGYRSIRRRVRCGPIGRRERIALWAAFADPSAATVVAAPTAVADWALRPAEIRIAAHAAPAGDTEVSEVCRRLLMAATPELLTPLPLPYTWDDLVLPASTARHLREFEAQAAHRGEVLDDWGLARLTPLGRGVTALLAGPSGTGKTMSAQVVARSLGLDLYRVDLAGVVSKYIGETEKHLREVFDACERAPVMLLFDEADALFGKRTQVSDAHDRYANIEIDYVLQRMEQFDGVAVLATNRKSDLDSAFIRRLRFIIDFAPPGAAERERLWRLALEGATDRDGRPVSGDLDWANLGRELDLTGAGIKAAAVAAAFLARGEGGPIGTRHVLAAARRELAKQGVVIRPGQLEER